MVWKLLPASLPPKSIPPNEGKPPAAGECNLGRNCTDTLEADNDP